MELLLIIIVGYFMYTAFRNMDSDSGGYDVLDVYETMKDDKKKLTDTITKAKKPVVDTIHNTLKDNKPEIVELIQQAVYAEQDTLNKIENDITRRIKTDSDFDPEMYYIFHGINFQNKDLEINCGSSREMFQVLNARSYDAEYDADKDVVTGTIKAYKIELERTKDQTGTYISAYATLERRGSIITELAYELKKEYDSSTALVKDKISKDDEDIEYINDLLNSSSQEVQSFNEQEIELGKESNDSIDEDISKILADFK